MHHSNTMLQIYIPLVRLYPIWLSKFKGELRRKTGLYFFRPFERGLKNMTFKITPRLNADLDQKLWVFLLFNGDTTLNRISENSKNFYKDLNI